MCQLTVKMLRGDQEEVLARGVATIEFHDGDIVLLPLFEDPIAVPHATIVSIDSLNSIVLLREASP